jgi:hypothetical protein
MAGTQATMIRATRSATLEAKRHGEPMPLWRDGRVVRVSPEEMEQLLIEGERKLKARTGKRHRWSGEGPPDDR